jgi:hypothetical protein
MNGFRVEIFARHRVAALFFGRLDVSEDSLTVWARPAWMLRPRTASHDTIRRVLVRHTRYVEVITIDDTSGIFAGININVLVTTYGKVRRQLESCGYVVADRP